MPKHAAVSPERIAWAKWLHAQGHDAGVIATAIGVSTRSAASYVLSRYPDIEPMPFPIPQSCADRTALWNAYEQVSSQHTRVLYRSLIVEETGEVRRAKTLTDYADGLIDTAVVVMGMQLALGDALHVCPWSYAHQPRRHDLVQFLHLADGFHHFADEHLERERCRTLLILCNQLIRQEGLDPIPLWDEVHRSNLSKLDLFGKPIRRADGKVVKGPSYCPPDLARLIEAQGQEPTRAIPASRWAQGLR
jgi:hypothetical protein